MRRSPILVVEMKNGDVPRNVYFGMPANRQKYVPNLEAVCKLNFLFNYLKLF